MESTRYTAWMRFDNAITLSQDGNDYQALLKILLDHLEEEGMVAGKILITEKGSLSIAAKNPRQHPH